MRVGGVRVGRLAVAVAASGALATVGATAAAAKPVAVAPATPAAVKHAFKVTIYPAYTTAGLPTTFEVKVANTSGRGTTLKSLQLEAPVGFTLTRPGPNAPLRRKTLVSRRMLSVHQISVSAGSHVQFDVTGTSALKTCGNTVRRWTPHAFTGVAPTGPQLALNAALSNVGVTVVCPKQSTCGVGGQGCTTTVPTAVASYAVASNATAGTLHGTINVGRRLTCGAYQFHDPNWYDSILTPPTTPPPTGVAAPSVDVVSYTIRNTRTQGLDFCLGATYDFATAAGSQAPARTLPNGKPGFIGLLPMCTPATPPCISNISQTADAAGTGYDAMMTVQIPDPGDPWGSG